MHSKKIAALLAALMLSSSMQALPLTAAEVRMSTVTLIGDANTDGKLGVTDVVKLSRFLLAADDSISANADVNGDGAINVFDLAYLKKMLLGTYTPEDYTKLVINEVCASNKKSLKSDDGSSPDWLEIYNGSDTDIHLSGYGVSDGTKKLFKYTFPEDTVIKAGGYLVVLCDGDGKVTPGKGEHLAPFNISAQKSETIYLTHPYNGTIDAFTIPEGMQTDVTYGRSGDGSETASMLTPTPGASNNNAEELAYVADPVFSVEGGFYDSAFLLEISAEGCEILYTLDGSDPRTSATAKTYSSSISVYDNTNEQNVWSAIQDITLDEYYPPDYPVDKGIIVRAAARDAGGNFSRVISNSYFIGKTADYYQNLKVISITTDGGNFFDNDTGIYMTGTQYYNWMNSPAFNPMLDPGDPANPTNYNSRGKEWEVPAAIQVFENGSAAYSANVGVRINGNWSRREAQKSLRLYARTEYGTSRLSYEFIPGLEDADGNKIASFDNLILRNNGNDAGQLYMRDALLQDLCKDRALGVQGYASSVVFINGEFWGFYNIRERIDENYLESHYHVDKDDVTVIKNMEPEGDLSLTDAFAEFCTWGASADMTNAANYSRVCETIDVESLMDLIAIETYLNNYDFAPETYINNNYLWRVNTPDDSNPYADGKWRFVLSDIEYSTNMYRAEGTAPEYDSLNHLNNDTSIRYNFVALFYNLLHNDSFRQEFEARYKDIMENTLSPERIISETDAYAGRCRDAIEDTKSRFGVTWYDYDTEMESFRNFVYARPDFAALYLDRLLAQYDGRSSGGNMLTSVDQWGTEEQDGSACDLHVISATEFRAETTVAGPEVWNPQVYYGGLVMEAGKTYRLSFTLEADKEMVIDTFIQRNGGEYEVPFWQDMTATTKPTKYEFDFVMDMTASNLKWGFDLGYGCAAYHVSDLSLVCLDR